MRRRILAAFAGIALMLGIVAVPTPADASLSNCTFVTNGAFCGWRYNNYNTLSKYYKFDNYGAFFCINFAVPGLQSAWNRTPSSKNVKFVLYVNRNCSTTSGWLAIGPNVALSDLPGQINNAQSGRWLPN